MNHSVDILIVGAGPGGLAAAILAQEKGLSHCIIEKGSLPMQGILDTYPKGKTVYPTIPRSYDQTFPVPELAPPPERVSVEAYVDQIREVIRKRQLNIRYQEQFQDIQGEFPQYRVTTDQGSYQARHVILAFGAHIPNDLGIYGEARTVARKLENGEDYIGAHVLVIGGGNAAADVVASLSRTKREAQDTTSVYWAHVAEKFEVNTDTARDLGEEILLGGQIKILQRAVPKIGEVDDEGIDRLYIRQDPQVSESSGMQIYQAMSFPMKHVIACIGTHGPSAIFDGLQLQQITCTGAICKIAKEGERLPMLTTSLETNRKGIFALGGAISPSHMEIDPSGMIQEKKHSNLIYTAILDARIIIDSLDAPDPGS